MKIGLIDVDGHHFPNLALMRISSWHKSQGDSVEWWLGDLFHYDVVYRSKVFSFSNDVEVWNADKIVQGGTGYAISLDGGGYEKYDKALDGELPSEVEHMKPDYSIYPEYDFAIAMTSRGCVRNCPFCHVVPKEGRKAIKVADVSDFWQGQKKIQVLDPNITACKDKHELFEQYIETGAKIMFNQGLDIRLTTEADIEYLNRMKLESLHFAWDNPDDDLEGKFEYFAKHFTRNKRNLTEVFCLTNYGNYTVEEHKERLLHRVYILRELGYNPYVMIYDKAHAPKELKQIQRWCNNKYIFRSCDRFEDYDMKRG